MNHGRAWSFYVLQGRPSRKGGQKPKADKVGFSEAEEGKSEGKGKGGAEADNQILQHTWNVYYVPEAMFSTVWAARD